jgi:hypothetical protein
VDIINNSVYCFYWSEQNLAYVLANIDANIGMVDSMPELKPIRPYFWTLLHGGGGGWRWWRGQPLPNEEKRAMMAMAFFTGIDGVVTWNWSGTGNHHKVPEIKMTVEKDADYFSSGPDLMIGSPFKLPPEGAPDGSAPDHFRRYDVIHVTDVDNRAGRVQFQKIRPHFYGERKYGITRDQPTYAMPIDELRAHLRIKSEPVSAMIEGMALVKPLEYILSHGEVMIEVDAREQFRKKLPIVRRVKLGGIHVLITYDPAVIYGGKPRTIVLSDFDGHVGLTLKLPADSSTRVFVLREAW